MKNEAINGLFHRELGLPPGLDAFTGLDFSLVYTRHARQAMLNDRYGIPRNAPRRVKLTADQIVEAEFSAGRCVKVVARIPHCNRFDLVIVLCNPEPVIGEATVKTVWLNCRDDKHSTLRANLYTPFKP